MEQMKLPFKSQTEIIVDAAIELAISRGRTSGIHRDNLIDWVNGYGYKNHLSLGVDDCGRFISVR